jgi:hypothetical protein
LLYGSAAIRQGFAFGGCAKKREPPSSDGSVIGKQNRFCMKELLTIPTLISKGRAAISSFYLFFIG